LRYFTICLPSEDEMARLVAHLQQLKIPFQSLSGQIHLHDPNHNAVIVLSHTALESLWQ